MKLASFFETRTRDNGDKFVTCIDTTPEWLAAAIRDAHQGDMPSDWIFETIKATCEAIDDGPFDADSIGEFADANLEIYTKALYQWAADMCGSSTYSAAEEQASEVGSCDANASIEDRIRVIQYYAIQYIADSILQARDANPEPYTQDEADEGVRLMEEELAKGGQS